DRQTGHEAESAADERAHGAPLCRMGYDVHGTRNLGAAAGARQSLDRDLRTGATMRVRLGIAALLFSLLPFDGAAQAVIEANGAAELGVALRRLGTTKRVLMVAAHPDDENTALIAELALGEGADVAYLSLTRGEGGQNLIGPELQEGLGLIRSEELLAARRLDGARQFFTRAYDYRSEERRVGKAGRHRWWRDE